MKKDPRDWSSDDWIDHVLLMAWGVVGVLTALLFLFWLAAIFEVLP